MSMKPRLKIDKSTREKWWRRSIPLGVQKQRYGAGPGEEAARRKESEEQPSSQLSEGKGTRCISKDSSHARLKSQWTRRNRARLFWGEGPRTYALWAAEEKLCGRELARGQIHKEQPVSRWKSLSRVQLFTTPWTIPGNGLFPMESPG